MKSLYAVLVILTVVGVASPALAEDNVLIPSQMELNDEQKGELQELLDKKLSKVVKTCVGSYARPEFYTSLQVQFELRKSGELRGGYVPGGVVDSNMYVKSDDDKAKLEEEGSFTRLVVRNDRDLERCLKSGTRSFETKLNRYSATVNATFEVSWKGKEPALKSTAFEVVKK